MSHCTALYGNLGSEKDIMQTEEQTALFRIQCTSYIFIKNSMMYLYIHVFSFFLSSIFWKPAACLSSTSKHTVNRTSFRYLLFFTARQPAASPGRMKQVFNKAFLLPSAAGLYGIQHSVCKLFKALILCVFVAPFVLFWTPVYTFGL